MPRVVLSYVRTSNVRDPRLLERCEALLLPDERQRHRAFVFERHRHEYLVTRALARIVLAEHVGVSPQSLAFVRNAYGRPELSPPSRVRFNLTNSPELVACAVTEGAEVGVDTEPLARAPAILGIADSVFTARERVGLTARGAAEQWTLKEAYMKARGLGMSLPVLGFEVVDGKITPAGEWVFATREVAGHLLSVCVEGVEASVELREADLAAALAPES